MRSKPSNTFPDYVAVRQLLLRMKERHVSVAKDAIVQSERLKISSFVVAHRGSPV